jgi:tyrosyl-tRNA synthetase
MGGSDQWGNMTTGTELIRRKCGGEAFVFTNPLITKTDGGKFGKTEAGNIWLDPAKTTPYQFYQFWLNASDEDAKKWISIFTFLPKAVIDELLHLHQADPAARKLQKKLAEEVTRFVHGPAELEKALATTEKLFLNQQAPISSLSEQDLASMEGVVHIQFPMEQLTEGIDIVGFLSQTGILASKGEARKLVQGGGISINRKKVESIDLVLNPALLLHGKYLLIQKGKKNYYLAELL